MAKKPRGCFNGKWFPLNKMASVTVFPFSPLTSRQHALRRSVIFRQAIRRKTFILRSNGKTPATGSSTDRDSESEKKNVLLKLAWYSSELLGIAASIVRAPANVESQGREVELAGDELGVVDQAQVVRIIKEDFKRSYFVTGNLTLNAYEEDCEFADPAASFRGLRRFKRNCTNFGSLIKKSKMDLMKWEDFQDKGIGHWRFSCILLLPWRPILSATGYTEFYFDPQSGRVCRHVEHWNVPKMALLKQIFRPTRWMWDNKTGA